MKKTIETEHIPIMLWLSDPDAETLRQARNLATLPFAFHHVALMPDAHQGYGMPIGGVLATIGMVVPNAVGVDIGCGMCAVRTDLSAGEVDQQALRRILSAIRDRIPLGFKHHKKAQDLEGVLPLPTGHGETLPVVTSQYAQAHKQLGTLGGGNHFIEIQRGSDRRLWLMVHSGSRNLGYQVAGEYNKEAIALARQAGKALPANWQLDGLPLDSEAGQRYLAEMQFCVAFARANRHLMMTRIQQVMAEETGNHGFSKAIDVAHNYAALEEHFGHQVMVHRKGATRAGQGEQGIIPGSQGSKSYLVRGLGNALSFCSCSHGAGRVLGRKQACRQLDLAAEIEALKQKKIIHSLRCRRDLEEAPGAYKDIDTVMRNQEDLVEIEVVLSPLAVIKG